MSQFLIAVALFVLPLATFVAPARADNASSLLAMVNSLRASRGVGPLYADPTLSGVAQAWSVHLAASGLGHNPNLASQVGGGWTKLGENVAGAGNIQAIFSAFVNSPFHLSNMLDPTYNLTGIGVAARADGTLWVTEDFEGKPGATPATTKPPTTTPAATAPPQTRPTPQTTIPAPKSTSPPTTSTPTTAAPATTVAPSQGPETTTIAPASDPPTTPAPRLAAGKPIAATKGGGGTSAGLVVTLAVAAMATVAGVALIVTRGLHRP